MFSLHRQMPHAANSSVRERGPTYRVTFRLEERCPWSYGAYQGAHQAKIESETLTPMLLVLGTYSLIQLYFKFSKTLNAATKKYFN